MKKYIFIALVGILCTSCTTIKEREIRNLEKFDTVHLVGNVEFHLKQNSDHAVEIIANNASDIANLITEVRNGELYIYNKKECDHCETPKYIIYLNHSGISDLTLTGVIKVISDDVISQNDLTIRGDGILNGDLEVSVTTLNVDLKGITHIKISGYTDTSNLKVTGIGMINATRLSTQNDQNVSEGIALINK